MGMTEIRLDQTRGRTVEMVGARDYMVWTGSARIPVRTSINGGKWTGLS